MKESFLTGVVQPDHVNPGGTRWSFFHLPVVENQQIFYKITLLRDTEDST
jgi:hypothetical protein